MKAIIGLVSSLGTRECRNISHSLSRFSSKGHRDTLFLKLFRLLQKHGKKHADGDFYCEKLFGRPKDPRFPMLKNRFRRKLIDGIATDQNVMRNPRLELFDKHYFLAQNNLITAKVLQKLTGKTTEFLYLITESEAIGKKYELYNVLAECLNYKKYYRGYVSGTRVFNQINKQIEFLEFCATAVHKASDYYYQVILRSDFHSSLPSTKMIEKLREMIFELNQDYAHTKSATVRYYQKYLEMEYYNLREELASGELVCQELVELLQNNPAVYRVTRLGAPLINLSFFQLKQGKYSEAMQSARAAIQFVKKNSDNYFAYNEYLFFSLFYSKLFSDATKLMDQLIADMGKSIGEFREAKFKYFKACILCVTGKHKIALKLLGDITPLSSDQAGWDINSRLLRIICAIESNNLDLAQSFLVDLQKQYYRIRSHKIVSLRNRLCISLFIEIGRKGFNFSPSTEKIRIIAKKLSDINKPYSWNVISPEIIPIHQWVFSKLKSRIETRKFTAIPN